MNTVLTFIFFSIITSSIYSQNFGFEEWESGSPDGWYINNILTLLVPIEQSTEAHSGQYAIKGSVVPAAPNGYAPTISAGEDLSGFPLNQRISALNGWYKFNSDSGDMFFVSITILKNNQIIGAGGFTTTNDAPEYVEFNATLTTNSVDTPDVIKMAIGITGPKVHVGSYFYLDDLSYQIITTGVEEDRNVQFAYKLKQNYPNPFNPSTTIEYTVAELNNVKITVFDAIGREIDELVNQEQSPGNYKVNFDGGNLSSGLYFYRMISGSFSQTKQFLLMK